VSWTQLLSLIEDAAEAVRVETSGPPTACPNDGKPLTGGPNGELHCTFDGWIWDGKPIKY
jgi:hypothetical protein